MTSINKNILLLYGIKICYDQGRTSNFDEWVILCIFRKS